MSHYLDDPELTAETIVDGWLLTGDLGRFEPAGHLQLFGRKKNMIVSEGGKNIYPEDIESAFEGIDIKEHSVFAANFIWPQKELGKELLVLVLHPDLNQEVTSAVMADIVRRNRGLPDFKRIGGYLISDKDFPRTASMKVKRSELAEQIRQSTGRDAVKPL
jgi:long-chain acyl-CoA synthetase